MTPLSKKIQAILFYRNTSTSLALLCKITGENQSDIIEAISEIKSQMLSSGIVLLESGEDYSLGTSPDTSEVIETIAKEENTGELTKASVETLSIILYRGPITRKEIDYIRGVNSSYIIRALEIRGLILKTETVGEKSWSFIPSLEVLAFMGVTKREEIPDYATVISLINKFETGANDDTKIEKNTDTEEHIQNDSINIETIND